jgi:hypothetical protein
MKVYVPGLLASQTMNFISEPSHNKIKMLSNIVELPKFLSQQC